MANLIGHSVGRYQIIEQLGRGGMATVYKAFDSRLERDVAIKFIRSDVVSDESFLIRFEREAKALAKLSNPHIVKVLDYGDYENMPYLVMEFIPGDTLKKKLGKPIHWKEAAKMLAPIAKTLDYIHKNNIIHRDVKPSNFLVGQGGELMLSDFGIAKMVDRKEDVQLTGTGVGIGTPEYMAPEQGLGSQIDGRADIYALGIVFYEMLTGRTPYQADTPMAVMYKQISEPLPPPAAYAPDLPEFVEKVLIKALAKKPEDRYQSMAEFAKALEGLVQKPVQEQPPTADFQSEPTRMAYPTQQRPAVTPTPPPASAQPYQQAQPYRQNQAPAVKEKKSSRGWITCGVILVIVLCLGTGIFALLGGFGAISSMFAAEPQGLEVHLNIPSPVSVGNEFEILVESRNTGSKDITISEIQLPKDIFGAAINTRIVPSPLGENEYTNTVGYEFGTSLAPGESSSTRFVFEPLLSGDYSGEVIVKVGNQEKATAFSLVIEEQAISSATNPADTPVPQPTSTSVEASPTNAQQSPTLTPVSGLNLLRSDDFSDSTSGWFTGTDSDGVYEYRNGEYWVTVNPEGRIVWVYLGESAANVKLSINTRVEASGENSGYGLICRYVDEENFYGFEISEDGYYTIWKRVNDEYIYLQEWEYWPNYPAVGQTAEMSITCLEDQLTLSINGELISEVTDSTFTSGDLGLFVSTYDYGNVTIAFDNFKAYYR